MGHPAIKLSLYAIDAELQELENELLANGGELSPEIEERYDDLLEMRPEKVKGYIAVIRSLEATATGIAEERKRLQDAERAAQNAARRLKDRLAYQMEQRGETEHVTPIGKVRLQSASRRPVDLLVDVEDLPEAWRKVTIAPDKTAIEKALKDEDPEAMKVAAFGPASKFVRIY